MKIDITQEQIEEIKYLYENTLYTIEQLADKFNTSWNKMSSIIHEYNIIKPDNLKHQILVNRNDRRWSSMTPEQRSNNAKKGHLKKQGKYKKEIYRKVSLGVSKAYHNKSSDEKDRLAKEHSKKVKLYWKNLSEEERKQFSETQRTLWTLEKRKQHGIKISETYQKQSEEEKIRRRSVTGQKSNEMWQNMSEDKKISRNKKISDGNKEVWHKRSEYEKSEIYDKIFNTMTKNKSFGKSKMEEQLNDLFQLRFKSFIWQYRIKNYWFDFYVEEDGFITLIELNGKYWHCNHPFKDCEEDENLYKNLMNNDKPQYKVIAKRWKYTDTKKLNFCKETNKNLIVIYYDGLNQVEQIYNFILGNLNKGIKILIL